MIPGEDPDLRDRRRQLDLRIRRLPVLLAAERDDAAREALWRRTERELAEVEWLERFVDRVAA